jgi:hypothetical protein
MEGYELYTRKIWHGYNVEFHRYPTQGLRPQARGRNPLELQKGQFMYIH